MSETSDDFADPYPPVEFGTPGAMRDRLVQSILRGEKTATSSLLREYITSDETLPCVGDRCNVVDSHGQIVCAIEVTSVEVRRLADVSLQFAIAEGEGFRSVAEWRSAHERFWNQPESRMELGPDFRIDDDTEVVLERFTVLR